MCVSWRPCFLLVRMSFCLWFAWTLLFATAHNDITVYIPLLFSLNSRSNFIVCDLPGYLVICNHNYPASWNMHGLCFVRCSCLLYCLDISSLAFLLLLGPNYNTCLLCLSFLTAIFLATYSTLGVLLLPMLMFILLSIMSFL